MKKSITTIAVSVIAGCILGILAVNYLSSPKMMLENESRYDFETTLSTIEQSAKAAGWSTPAIHDLQKSMEKAGKQVNPVKVFALCNPEHAVKILAGDEQRIYSNMMPCRLAVYTKSDGKTYISRQNIPVVARKMPGEVKKVMKEAYGDIETILAGIVAE